MYRSRKFINISWRYGQLKLSDFTFLQKDINMKFGAHL